MVVRLLLSVDAMAPYYLYIVKQKTSDNRLATRISAIPAFAGFAVFGAFWGTWGASIPRIKEQAGVDDAQLGIALLLIGAGALPAMLFAGHAIDRWRSRAPTIAVIALGVFGAASVTLASNLTLLCIGLTVVGAASGATDVAISSMAGRAEQASGRPVIARANGVFSSFVVLSSLGTGMLAALDIPTPLAFVIVTVLSVAAGIVIARADWPPVSAYSREHSGDTDGAKVRGPLAPLLLIGILGALAFASENAHQSWSALVFHDVLHASPASSALAPAVFAGVVAVTRFSIGAIRPERSRTVLLVGATAAAIGATVISVADSIPIAVLGLAIAAAGTGALYPTLLSIVSRNLAESHRGRATSLVAMVSYVGFLLGPVYVGFIAQQAGLRGAMLGVAALGILLLILAAPLLKLSRFTAESTQ
jgi:MFS family permease